LAKFNENVHEDNKGVKIVSYPRINPSTSEVEWVQLIKSPELEDLIGEKQENPTQYTELGRLKSLEDKIGAIYDWINGTDFSTAAKQDLAKTVLDNLLTKATSLDGKDYATQTTLAELKAKIDDMWAAYDSATGTFKVAQYGSIVSLNSNGSIADTDVKEYRCLSTDTKIDASTVPKYSMLIEMDTDNIYYSDGTDWQVKM